MTPHSDSFPAQNTPNYSIIWGILMQGRSLDDSSWGVLFMQFSSLSGASTDPGRSASSPPAFSAIWSRPRPQSGRQAGWRVDSQDRRGRPAKPLTPVFAEPLSTWKDEKYDFKEGLNGIFFLYSLPSSLLSSLLSFVQDFTNIRTPKVSISDLLQAGWSTKTNP